MWYLHCRFHWSCYIPRRFLFWLLHPSGMISFTVDLTSVVTSIARIISAATFIADFISADAYIEDFISFHFLPPSHHLLRLYFPHMLQFRSSCHMCLPLKIPRFHFSWSFLWRLHFIPTSFTQLTSVVTSLLVYISEATAICISIADSILLANSQI